MVAQIAIAWKIYTASAATPRTPSSHDVDTIRSESGGGKQSRVSRAEETSEFPTGCFGGVLVLRPEPFSRSRFRSSCSFSFSSSAPKRPPAVDMLAAESKRYYHGTRWANGRRILPATMLPIRASRREALDDDERGSGVPAKGVHFSRVSTWVLRQVDERD